MTIVQGMMAAAFGKRQVQAYLPRAAVARATTHAPAAVDAAPRASTARLRIPIVTPLLLVVLAVVFFLEAHATPILGKDLAPPLRVLVAFGAVDRDLVLRGDWWRLFTAPLLHANIGHLTSNAVVLAVAGFMLEPLVGPRWFAGLYAIGALGGSLCSIAMNAPDVAAVGASGAIMGVLAAAFLVGASAKAGPKGGKLQSWALRMMLPALIPLATDSHIDFAGHLGGVLSGLAAGVVLRLAWTRGEDEAAFGSIAAGIGAATLAAGVIALMLAMAPQRLAAATAQTGLIPDAQMPRDNGAVDARAADLVARYPRDPRAHLLRGMAFVDDHDLADAETQFRLARDPEAIAAAGLSEDFGKSATVLLALTVAYQHRPDVAYAMGHPLCDYARAQEPEYFKSMVATKLCGS